MTRYELLVFLHVFAAVAWVGGVFMAAVLWEVALRAKDYETLVKLIQYDDRLGKIYWMPAVLLVLTAGLGLVLDGPWQISDSWILLGLAILIGALVLVFTTAFPAARRLDAAVRTSGADSPEARRQLLALRRITWVELAGLAVAVFVMTTKPF